MLDGKDDKLDELTEAEGMLSGPRISTFFSIPGQGLNNNQIINIP